MSFLSENNNVGKNLGPLLFVTFLCLGSGVGCSSNGKVETIPLSSIYSNNGQEGLKEAGLRDIRLFEKPNNRSFTHGLSTILLVYEKDILDAVKSTRIVFLGGETPPINKDEQQHWLVVFFGRHPSSPCWWIIDSVERSSGKMSLNYHNPTNPPLATTADMAHYFAWVPLGKLKRGSYNVELRNSRTGEVELMRREEIKD